MTTIDRPDLTGDPLTVTCNYCGAPIGTPCRTRGSGRPRAAVHNDRPAKAAAVTFMRSLGHDADQYAQEISR